MNNNKGRWKKLRNGLARRGMSLLLAAVMLWGLLPTMTQSASAADWMESYLEKLVEWGVMRGNGSGNLYPDRMLTRAEFATMINRAFGYTERGATPFTDVPADAWYADDINIAYQAGYFTGTSDTTASPLGRVTREQAAVLLGRNLRLQGIPGVNSDFTDVQQMGNWSRGMVQECAELGIIQGYADGTFRPKNYITRGQMACFLVRALGTLVHETGDQIAGGVYGNLTVNTSGVKLKDTVVTGNLYLSGGVGLGNVELENVTVMGKIVVCGAGEAERGESSIVLRNVTAEALEIDSLSNHFMTVRTEGLTNIANTTVRTSAFLEDVTDDDQGLRLITLDGTSDGTKLQLAGNIKEVVNITPNSDLQVVQGITGTLTVDERATGSSLSIANDTTVKILNLDAGVPVTGNGDVSKMNVNAAGSSATMLPDTIFIRPGIDSNINNKVMDSKAAEESSDEPRLLSGYPLIRNLASTSADGVFSTNKRGTLYWAVSTLLDGSVGEDELRNPAAYPGKILRSGTINVTASKTEMTTRLTGLSQEGSYYLSAMLVDERGHTSPVKMTAFTTTDDSVPAFAAGYPEAILTVDPKDEEEQIIQARVMATKTCQLYYALLPKNSTAPTANALRAGAVTGNLGYGTMEVVKNRSYLISRVNTAHLAEETTYDLYFWLNDADNGKSSAVRRLQVTTKDMTPPVVTNIYQSKSDRTSAQITFTMSERADLFWVAVKAGETLLRPPVTGEPIEPTDLAAKIQVEAGGGNAAVVSSGRTTAAQADTNYVFTVNRLEEQGVYDLYYVAKDPAGNYSEAVKILENVMTTDATPPLVELEFSRYNEGADGVINPWVESDVTLLFNEIVRGTFKDGSMDRYDDFYAKYQDVVNKSGAEQNQAKLDLAEALRKYIRLYPGTPPTSGNPRQDPVLDIGLDESGRPLPVGTDNPNKGSVPCWVDFREAVITRTDGRLRITFPGSKGIKMQSGGTYFFRLESLVDASGNMISPNPTYLPRPNGFTTAFATVRLANNQSQESVVYPAGSTARAAKIFSLTPEDTGAVPEETRWDMLIWTDASIDYQLLVRPLGGTDADWFELGTARPSVTNVTSGKVYSSLNGNFNQKLIDSGLFGSVGTSADKQGRPFLNEFSDALEFAIVPVETTLESTVNMEVQLFAGSNTEFSNISIPQGQASTLEGRDVTAIGEPDPFPITISPPGRAPTVRVPYLGIDAGDIAATVQLMVDRPGRVYYMAIPIEKDRDGNTPTAGADYIMYGTYPAVDGVKPDLETIPTSKREIPPGETETKEKEPMWLDSDAPAPRQVIRGTAESTRIRTGSTGDSLLEPDIPRLLTISSLESNTTYILYLVTTDENGTPAEKALCYKFSTTPPEPPKITIQPNGSTRTNILVDKPANVDYILVLSNQIQQSSNPFSTAFSGSALVEKAPPSGWSGTVLDAMLQPYNDGSTYMGSIFDVCATTAAKMEYAEYIREPNGVFVSPPPAMNGRNQFVQSQTGQFNLTGMQGRNYYTLVVVARGQNSTSDGFRASRSYYNVLNDYLYLLNCGIGENTSATPAMSYTGTMRITFSDSLHFNVQIGNEETPTPVDSCELSHPLHTGSGNVGVDSSTGAGDGGRVNIGSFMFPSQSIVLTSPAPNPMSEKGKHGSTVGPVLEFELKNAQPGASISFRAGICGSNGAVRGNTANAALQVTLRKSGTGDQTQWYLEWNDAWNRATD